MSGSRKKRDQMQMQQQGNDSGGNGYNSDNKLIITPIRSSNRISS